MQAGAEEREGSMDPMTIIVALAIGLVAGWLASLVVGGGGLIKYIA